jgi:hypothetical protein
MNELKTDSLRVGLTTEKQTPLKEITLVPKEPGAWVTKRQLALRYQCCTRTINNLMSRRILPFRKVRNFLRFEPAECDKAMDTFKVKCIAQKGW